MTISNPKKIQIKAYDYCLPEEKIAKYPLSNRADSKLLVSTDKKIAQHTFRDLPQWLPEQSLVVFNNTKVIQARLIFNKSTGARIEIFCLEPLLPKDYTQTFQQTQTCSWLCLIGNAKKWKAGTLEATIKVGEQFCTLKATKIGDDTNSETKPIHFSWDNEQITFADILNVLGELPIPPYLHRNTEESDINNYQTVYSKIKGSVAAPTAGLHFTPEILNALRDKNIQTTELTLHVGAGTFKPVKSDEIGQHKMHSELISINKRTLQLLKKQKETGKLIFAVGTTSVRTLESLYYLGRQLENNLSTSKTLCVSQWEPYTAEQKEISMEKALDNLLTYLEQHQMTIFTAYTEIMIAPGFDFKIVDGIITNFHQPQSTLLLLVSAFVGDRKREEIYSFALENNFRFLSYGDSSLLFKHQKK